MRRIFEPLRPESNHLLHLDALRLIASVGIVVHHIVPFIDDGAGAEQLLMMSAPLAHFVDMFFVVSGFVIAFIYSDKIADAGSYASFMRKRVARLAPLHWATLAFFVAIGIALQARNIDLNHGEIYDWRCLPTNFFLFQSTGLCQHVSYNGVTWSISAEMFMYAAAPAVFWVMRRSLIGLWALVIGVCILLSLWKINGDNWLSWTYSGGCLRAIPSFMLGCLIFGSLNTLKRLPFARPAYWAAILGFLAGCWIGLSEALLLLALFAAVAFGVAADAQKKPSAFVRLLAAGGQLTYSSYMLHPLVCMVLLNGVADHVLHAHGLARNLMVLVAFGVVWPISYLSLMFFEKPARRWMSGRAGTALRQPASAKVI